MSGSENPLTEFYCASSGGGCGGYLLFPLNRKIDGIVEVVCPKCGHKHQRRLKDGHLSDDDRHSGSPTQEIAPSMASWSKKSNHPETKKRAKTSKERKSVVIDADKARKFLEDRKFELYGGGDG